MSKKKLVSIITPCFNEEVNLNWYYQQVSQAIKPLEDKYNFEIIITDNHSTDRSWEIIRELSEKDNRIKAFRFSRNFGYQKSILTGYQKCIGDVAIEYDCDLQDPLELLPSFIQKWEEGNKIVYGIRIKRAEGLIITTLRKIFYTILNKISTNNLPKDAGDFMLIDRIIIDKISKINNKNPYLRGEIFSYGFKRLGIEYSRNARIHGNSKFPFSKMVYLAMDGLVSSSTFPLRIATLFGIFTTIIASCSAIFFIVDKMFLGGNYPTGIATILVLVLFGIAINSLLLGIVGEYLGRMYQQMISSNELTIIEDSI